MSADILAQLQAADAFEPMRRYEELPIDHVTYAELAGEDVEGRLQAAVTGDARCVSVVGPTGSGKSSLIATVSRQLPAEHPALRIPVNVIGEAAADPAEFGRHVVREVRRLLEAQLTKQQKKGLERADAAKVVRASRGGGFKAELALPEIKGLGAKLGIDLRSATEQIEHEHSASDVLGGLEQLIRVFAYHKLQPVLIVDDTDQWLGRDDSGQQLAHAFFSGPVRMIAKDLPISLVVATHQDYRTVDGYKEAAGLIEEICLPDLPHPREALATILSRRISASDVAAELEEALEPNALVRLEAEYDNRPRNLRHALLVAHVALRQSGPPYPERLGADQIRSAALSL